MKNIIALFLMLSSVISPAQNGITWQAPVPVAMSHYSNMHPRITVDAAGNPLVLWGKMATKEANFARWNGTAFSTPVVLNSGISIFADSWAGPDFASQGDTIYAVFKAMPEDTGHIYSVASFNGGLSFNAPVVVDMLADSVSRFPTVAIDDNGNPLVGFMKFDAGFMNARYAVARSTDFGASYLSDIQAGGHSGGEACDCCPAAMVSRNNTVVILYRDDLSDVRNIWAGISADNGNTFPTGLQMDQTNWVINSCPSSGPDGILVGDSLYVVYMSRASGDRLVYLSKASLGSTQPVTGTSITPPAGFDNRNYPRIANSGKTASAVWKQAVNGSSQVVMVFTKDISAGFPEMYDTVASGGVFANADIAIADSTVHVVWEDNNSDKVMYRKGTFSPDAVVSSLHEPVTRRKNVLIYPQPAGKIVTVQWNSDSNVTALNISDLNGKTVQRFTISESSQATLDIANLNSGVYFIRNQKSELLGRFVKE